MKVTKLIRSFRILDLTKYEVGNAARYDKKLENVALLMSLWEEIFSSTGEESITSLAEVQKIAKEHSITFYDASYIQVATHLGSKLVTLDREILGKFKRQAINLDEFEKSL